MRQEGQDKHVNVMIVKSSYQNLIVLDIISLRNTIKAAESVSSHNYCMWIFLFDKKLHMAKLSMRVKLIP